LISFRRRRRNIRRLRKILEVALKHGFGYFLESFELIPSKGKYTEPSYENVGRRLRLLLQDLGPTFVKIGQLLSVRPDLVPPDVIFELEKLQDSVPPFPFSEVKRIFQEDLEKDIKEIFSRFDEEPVASASIGQVHIAHLKDGGKVAVKVQRPGARDLIEADIDLLFYVAKRLGERITFVDTIGLVDELSQSLQRELDYRVEARNIDRFRHNFREDPLIKIPVVHWQICSKRILVMEYIEGTKVSDLATPERMGIDTYNLAVHGARAFMKMVLEDGFFHGDLHPANVLITPDGRIAYLDFGMVGYLSEEDRETITRMLLGIVRQDADLIVEEAKNLGVEIPRDKIPEMRRELREIIDRYYGRTLGEIEIDIIGREFLSLIYRHKIKIPKEYAMLAKALITIEGVAKKLYPQINILEVAKPYVFEVIRKRYGPLKTVEDFLEESKVYLFQLVDFPRQLHSLLGQLRRGEFRISYHHQGLEDVSRSIKEGSKLLATAFLFAALMISLPFLYFLSSKSYYFSVLGLLFVLLFFFLIFLIWRH
jgi:ubiquinone biosynthesis protein